MHSWENYEFDDLPLVVHEKQMRDVHIKYKLGYNKN
jgi:hypothetical protein